ncbi:MAG: hypothetical protein J07HB67_01090 [halophilic archaeon J07HB67]|jgi:hypothetical protein|nr:MAG: hypothetical protein J07HB67_01090 [halophilic archaeon J07HB67]
MAESDDPITEVDEELLDGESSGTDGLPEEVWLFAVAGAMVVATAGVFLTPDVPNPSAVMPVTICLGTAALGVRARLQ